MARLDRAIQYAGVPVIRYEGRGVLDRPLSRGMTAECVAGVPMQSRPPPLLSRTCSQLSPRELVGAKLAGDLVAHRIHHAGFTAAAKGTRGLDIFLDDRAAR